MLGKLGAGQVGVFFPAAAPGKKVFIDSLGGDFMFRGIEEIEYQQALNIAAPHGICCFVGFDDGVVDDDDHSVIDGIGNYCAAFLGAAVFDPLFAAFGGSCVFFGLDPQAV